MTHHWLSTRRMTVCVEVNNVGVIVDAPPVVKRFIGQRLSNLAKWMDRQGRLKHEVICED